MKLIRKYKLIKKEIFEIISKNGNIMYKHIKSIDDLIITSKSDSLSNN